MQTAQVITLAPRAVSAQKRTALITRYAALSAQLSELKAQLAQAKMEAVEILGEGEFDTVDAKLTIKWVERDVFDQATAKTLLTAAQLARCCKRSQFFDVRVKGA